MPALMPAADAIAALRAAGHCVTRTTRADAARRYGCQTLVYVIDGRGVNLGRLRQLAREALAPEAAPEATPAPAAPRPTLPGEATPPPAPAPLGDAAPALPPLPVAAHRAAAAAGRPVSLAALARDLGHSLGLTTGGRLPRYGATGDLPARLAPAAAPTGDPLEGQPWDPGTPEGRAAVALQGERAAILWPVAQALRGEGVALPPSWAPDGPVMGGDLTLTEALARLPLGAIAQAAAALAALPPVTAAQDAALALCRAGAVPGRPYL